jgi:hypothetical protein
MQCATELRNLVDELFAHKQTLRKDAAEVRLVLSQGPMSLTSSEAPQPDARNLWAVMVHG